MMGATQYDVYTMAPELASTLCRFCMKPEHGEPHYNLDWYKWPNAEVTRLYEKVVGQQVIFRLKKKKYFISNIQARCILILSVFFNLFVFTKDVGRFFILSITI